MCTGKWQGVSEHVSHFHFRLLKADTLDLLAQGYNRGLVAMMLTVVVYLEKWHQIDRLEKESDANLEIEIQGRSQDEAIHLTVC